MGPFLLPFLLKPATSELFGISVKKKKKKTTQNPDPWTHSFSNIMSLTPSMGHMAEHLGGGRSASSAGGRAAQAFIRMDMSQ